MRPLSARSFDHRDFEASSLVSLKRGRSVSVCIPARDEETTIAPIVEAVRTALVDRVGLVDEILVVDDGSADATAALAAAAGARVVVSESVLARHGAGSGKGQALWKATFDCAGDLIVYCDADVVDFGAHFVTGLLGPLLVDDSVALVKGSYSRPLAGTPGEGGRVTELMARPALSLLFPHLAHICQPLAGESASRRSVLENLPFSDGYGVEIGMLLEVADRFGPDSIAQVDLGQRTHRNRPLEELGPQARTILQVLLHKSGLLRSVPELADLPVDGPATGRPHEAERRPLVELVEYSDRYASRARGNRRGGPLRAESGRPA